MPKCEVNNSEHVLPNENHASLYMWYAMLNIEEYSTRWLLFMYVLLLLTGGFWREQSGWQICSEAQCWCWIRWQWVAVFC